jgi:DNA-binding response OmpR family regulator
MVGRSAHCPMMLSPGSFINIRPCSRRPERRYRMPPAHPKTSVPPTILLVEAEPMLRQTMAKFLGRSGFHVLACPDANCAATVLTQGETQPSLLVLAARVLDASTVALAHRLRALAPSVPMLGIADQIGPAADAPSGFPPGLRFLAPPFDLPDVLRAVRSWLPLSPSPHAESKRLEA